VPGTALRAEEVRNYDVGIERALGGSNAPILSFRRFQQSSTNQIATLFGLDAASDIGHYYVVSPGSMELDGWGVQLSTRIARRFEGSVNYSLAHADWDRASHLGAVRRGAPSVIRTGREQMHDIAASLNAEIPESNTHITMSYRLNNLFSAGDGGQLPVGSGRFEIELHQGLPYQPIHGGRVEFLFSIRNLMRDLNARGSLYDELLTVSPPLRVMGGVQVKF